MNKKEFEILLNEKLCNLYGDKVPDKIIKRFNDELELFHNTEFWLQNNLYIFCELLMLMNKSNRKYELIGAGGHSFLFYLLGITNANPLPPHYHCPRCGNLLWAEDIEMGIDLPLKMCRCGEEMDGDGFDLGYELFWDCMDCNLNVSVSEKDYEFVERSLYESKHHVRLYEYEWDFGCSDIKKHLIVDAITILIESNFEQMDDVIGWNEVRKHKEMILQNYKLLLPPVKEIKIVPETLGELIRLVAFFNTMYTKNVSNCVCEDDILNPDEMCLLLEKLYDNDINKVPVFVEDGIMLGEWCVEDYHFLILFTRAYADMVLDEINEKMSDLFEEE